MVARKAGLVFLGGVLFLGAFLRFYRISTLATFRGDQATELASSADVLRGKLTLIGIKTSVSEVKNGAVMYYLLAPFLWLFNFSPVAGGFLQSTLSLGVGGLTFLILRKTYGGWAAVLGLTMVVLSAMLVRYSRQTLLAFYPLFFHALIFYFLDKLVGRFERKVVVLLGFVCGFSMQVHYSTIAVGIFLALFPAFFLAKRQWFSYLGCLSLGFLIGFLPMILFESRHEFFNTKMLIGHLGESSGPSFGKVLVVGEYLVDAVSRFFFTGIRILAVTYLALLGALVMRFRTTLSRLSQLAVLGVVSNLVFVFLISSDLRAPFDYVSHYLIPSVVPLVVLSVSFLTRIVSLAKFAVFFLLLYLLVNFSGYGLFADHGFSMAPGWTQDRVELAARIVEGDVGRQKYNVAMLVDGETQGLPLRYFLDRGGNRPMPVFDYGGAEKLYVVVEPGVDLARASVWEIASFGAARVEKTWTLGKGFLLHRLGRGETVARVATEEVTIAGPAFVTLVYPVRGRSLWARQGWQQVSDHLRRLKSLELPATFLLQYDALIDTELAARWRDCLPCELGIFLEVSEKQATDAEVSYKVADGDWARPDKVFLNGYGMLERERLIDTVFAKFHEVFGRYPETIGSWYIDPYSLSYLRKKYLVSGYVAVADQYDTDNQRDWGKPWGVPFYVDKYDSLSRGRAGQGLLQIQWAQRQPTAGFGKDLRASRSSLQANDYVNNGYSTQYFTGLLDVYTGRAAATNGFGQATVGLEVGQELAAFEEEHARQLAVVRNGVSDGRIRAVTVADFVSWYAREGPPPEGTFLISDGRTLWVNHRCYRAGLKVVEGQVGGLFDLRLYGQGLVSPDFLARNDKTYRAAEVVAALGLGSPSGVVSFDQNRLSVGAFTLDVSSGCDKRDEVNVEMGNWLARQKEAVREKLAILRTSQIEGKRVVGVAIARDKIFGWWSGKGWGVFSFPYQTLAKFQTLGALVM